MIYIPPFTPCEEPKGKYLGPFWIPEEDDPKDETLSTTIDDHPDFSSLMP